MLFVCTGNVCRSPMAELLLRAEARSGLEVASAGMHALVGEGIDPPSGAVLAERGIDASAHRARQFEVPMAAHSDLVLTAECMHRDRILTEAPTLYRRVFTMKEYARLAVPIARATPAEVVAAAAARRGVVEAVAQSSDDIVDPFRGTVAQARAVAEQLRSVVEQVIATVASAAPRHADPNPT